jgi:hypothetical protein
MAPKVGLGLVSCDFQWEFTRFAAVIKPIPSLLARAQASFLLTLLLTVEMRVICMTPQGRDLSCAQFLRHEMKIASGCGCKTALAGEF